MPDYDASHFDPPAPVARVKLRDPKDGVMVSDVVLLLDTGVDVTLLPRTAVERLGVPIRASERYELIGFGGSRSSAPVVALDMILLERAFRGLYLLIEEERGIMGRDILSHVAIVLDGPRQQWSEHSP